MNQSTLTTVYHSAYGLCQDYSTCLLVTMDSKVKGRILTIHYLDDFLTIGPAASPICQQNLDIFKSTCCELGVPLLDLDHYIDEIQLSPQLLFVDIKLVSLSNYF